MLCGGSVEPPRGKGLFFAVSGVCTIVTVATPLEEIFGPLIKAAGFELVRLRMTGTKRQTLQVMAERPDGSMDVDGCAELSSVLSDFIETEDPIGGDYLLEVSSPGIDRPLTRLNDFARWAGHEVKITFLSAVAGRKRLRGELKGVSGSEIAVAVENETIQFPFDVVGEAKLVLTDKLIEEDMRLRQMRQG